MSDPARPLGQDAVFGAGGDDPYTRALHAGHPSIGLHSDDRSVTVLPLARYLGEASPAERALIDQIRGPVLDVGCGPGRMVAAAIVAGNRALGVDVSAAAVAVAAGRGLPVLQRSVFDRLPREGRWGSALLLDGNIGIGGHPVQLLRRCAQLVSASGWIVVETHADHARDVVIEGRLVDVDGKTSGIFPWAEVGARALDAHAVCAGLVRARGWTTTTGRTFAAYARRG